jgi:YD repeat-containing protein
MCKARVRARKGLGNIISTSALIAAAAVNVLMVPAAWAGTTGASSYTYDELGRVRSVTYSNGSTVNYTYDAAGNRTQVVHFNNNHNPVANADSASTAYVTKVSLNPRGNDTDADGDSLAIIAVGTAAHGATAFTGTSVSYTPKSGYYGSDSFTYTISDGRGGTASSTVTVTVGTPPPPTVAGASINTSYNTASSTSLTINGVYSSTAVVTAASHGTASVSGATATYTPTTGYVGSDTFTYRATGPGGNSSPATVTISVAAPDVPVVTNKTLSVGYNTAGAINLAPTGVYTTLAIPSAPTHGAATISGTTATYTPTSGYYGADTFTFTATGPGGTSSPATVHVTVATPARPVVSNKSLTTPYNTAGTVNLAPSGVYTSMAIPAAPTHGTASISGGIATYTPTSGYYGHDSFTFNATGPGGTSGNATASITVSMPAPPVVGNKTLTTAYNTAGTVNLVPTGVYTSMAIPSAPTHGTVALNGANATYTPTNGYYGADSFKFNATGPGGTSSNATVSVTVGKPAAPVVSNKTLTTAYGVAGTVNLAPTGVYTSMTIPSGPSHGTATITGTTAKYTPAAGYSGSDSFTFKATGPGGSSGTATVSVIVQANPTIIVTSASNLRTLANNAGYTGISGVQYQFEVPSGTTIMGSAGGGAAITTGTWPNGVTIALIVKGNVYGGGGTGGHGGAVNGISTSGGGGGDAVAVHAPIVITVNSGGAIIGGGGGGGGGRYFSGSTPGGQMSNGGGGGGGGFPNGSGGSGGMSDSTPIQGDGSPGGMGTISGGGAGGAGGGSNGGGGYLETGGAGGGQGANGAEGVLGGSAGGNAGYAIRKNGNTVTVTNNGTITGTQG